MWGGRYPDTGVHANAEEESHSFSYLVDAVFDDSRVSKYLLDPIRETFISKKTTRPMDTGNCSTSHIPVSPLQRETE
jgi:hypothetical protein